MDARRWMLWTVAVGLAVGRLGGPGAASGEGLMDERTRDFILDFAQENEDANSHFDLARKASCTVGLTVATSVAFGQMTASMTYAWEDADNSGTIGQDEITIQPGNASVPMMMPYMLAAGRTLAELAAMGSTPRWFLSQQAATWFHPGSIALNLRPPEGAAFGAGVSYVSALLTMDGAGRPLTMQIQLPLGAVRTRELKTQKVGNKWRATGFVQKQAGTASQTTEDWTVGYTTVDGVLMPSKITIVTKTAAPMVGVVTVTQVVSFQNWQIQKRAQPLPLPGAPAQVAIRPKPRPKPKTPTKYALAKTLEGHTGAVLTVVFSPDGKGVASAGADKAIRIWNAADGKCLRTLAGHADTINAIAFSPDGKQLVSGTEEEQGNLRVWDTATGKQAKVLEGGPAAVLCVAWSPDNKRIAAAGDPDGRIHFWDAATLAHQEPRKAHEGVVNAIAFSPPGSALAIAGLPQLLSGSADKTAKIWKADGKPDAQLAIGAQVMRAALSASGAKTATAGLGNDIAIWGNVTHTQVKTLKGHEGQVLAIACYPIDGKYVLASGSQDTTVRVWDYSTGDCLQNLEGHKGAVNAVAFSPDGKHIVSGSDDKTVRIWSEP